ncbi:MAG TPA: DUF4231 domain-containing protein [Candidatus Sericytochromatia bacterium]|jgi:FtsZ-interacting cell division protein ZipA
MISEVKAVAKKDDYRQYLKQTFGGLIDRLDLSDLRKDFLKNRWLDQVMWLEGRATKERNRHHALRLTTIIGGVIIPALVGFGKGNNRWQDMVGWSAFGLSQVVAVSAAVEEFFAPGEKYRNYRNTAEGLKIEGWEFFQLTGAYRQFETHTEGYSDFAQRVEQYIKQDVQGFISQLEEKKTLTKKETEETAPQNAQVTQPKLNQPLQLPQANLEEQLQQLEAEKHRLEEQKQQLEKEQLAQPQSKGEKPADKGDVVVLDNLPSLSTAAMTEREDEENHDNSSPKV